MSSSAESHGQSRGRARTLGPGLLCSVALASALVLAGCGGASGGGGSGSGDTSALAGRTTAQYPSFLPKKTLNPTIDATLTGTEAKPALQSEGLAIKAETKAFHVDVTVSGPIVPGEGLPDQPAATTCTWTVTMKNATADVPVSIADFHSVDHLGSVFLMGLVPGEHAPPSVLHPGQRLTFQLRSYELVGEGMMQWAPDHKHVVGYWDYTVEND
jgi:hypothetical protein